MTTQNDPKGLVTKILQECLDTHKEREKSYDKGGNVFDITAAIANLVLNRGFSAEEVAFIFVAMKLARYSSLRDEILEDPSQLPVIWDTVKDTMVYMGLTERERQREHPIDEDSVRIEKHENYDHDADQQETSSLGGF